MKYHRVLPSFSKIRLGPFNLLHPSKIIFCLWLFLLVFPKGGFKIGSVPITWGYLLLAICSVVLTVQTKWRLQEDRTRALLCLLPFQCVAIGTMICNGIADPGMGASFLISFFFLPFTFFLLFSNAIETLDAQKLFELIRKGVFAVSIYGIVLFLVRQVCGTFLEIPFLTVNWGDLGELDTKHINRGGIVKLISTYNNGNIYGICILILFPLFTFLEKNRWKNWIVKLSLILTFSRTVWIGLLFSEIIFHLFVIKKAKEFIVKVVAISLFVSAFIAWFCYLLHFPWNFFFDSSLGGRSEYIEFSKYLTLFSEVAFVGITEIVYFGILKQFGLVGLTAFLLGMISPLLLLRGRTRSLKPVSQCIVCGLVTYLLMACSDGALLYIPTMAFYWFCCSLGLRREFA